MNKINKIVLNFMKHTKFKIKTKIMKKIKIINNLVTFIPKS